MQTYENHARNVPLYHYVAGPILIANAIYALQALRHGISFASVMYALTGIALVLIGFYARAFALAAQDRVIRLEMWLRLKDVLPGSQHADIKRLTARQLVALRFASDAELPSLVMATLQENLPGREIKKRIKTWVPDETRV